MGMDKKKAKAHAGFLMGAYIDTVEQYLDYVSRGDEYLIKKRLGFANRLQKGYAYASNGRDINDDLRVLYEANKMKESIRINGRDFAIDRIELLRPVFEKDVDLKRHTTVTPVDLRSVIDVYRIISDSVADEGYEREEQFGDGESKTERKVKEHPEDLVWLEQYKDVDGMVVADDLDYSLAGTIVDVQGIHADRRLGDSKLALALETEGQTVLVNARGAMHRNYGYITDSRVRQLKESLPKKDIDVTSDWELKQWFDEAGIEKSRYMKAKERAAQKLKKAQDSVEAVVSEKGLVTEDEQKSELENAAK